MISPKAVAILDTPVLTQSTLEVVHDPFTLFGRWLDEARASELNDPEAMTLATVDAEGLPDARMVLCKGVEAGALVFYTNAESAKGAQLAAAPRAAALFHWKSLRRQARFRGPVAELDAAASDAYFHSRPRGSQIGAWASRQSEPISSRAELERRVEDYTEKFGDAEIPRPPYWRGFRLTAEIVELWADGAFRLHDRIRFTRQGEGWAASRLSP